MTTMKIGWDSEITNYSDADLFSFPNNPRLLDLNLESQRVIKELPYSKIHMLIDKGGLKPRGLIINGHFQGAAKNTDINKLNNFIFNRDSSDSGLLRFYYNSDRFWYCFGAGMKQTMLGERTNFTDYVANLISPIPYVYSDTENSSSITISDANAHDITTASTSGSDFENNGSAPSHILEYTITNTTGATITKVEIADETALGGNKITWEGSLLVGKILKIYLFKIVDEIFKKLYYTNDGTFDGDRDFDGKEPPYIPGETTTPTFSVKLTGNTGNTIVNLKWKESYWW